MGLFISNPPSLPTPPAEYSRSYMDQLLNILRLHFFAQNSVQNINVANLNLNLSTLPTQTSLAQLRPGDVYRDTTADNALKVKV
jgi:hypothetical protein